MVCNGITGESGWTPNLNREQKGVPGLNNALKGTKAQVDYSGSDPKIGHAIFSYRTDGNYPKVRGTRDMNTGVVTYIFKDGSARITAYDNDGDGNIDSYTRLESLKDENGESYRSERTYVNSNDNGQDDFKYVKPQHPGGNWNPLNWF